MYKLNAREFNTVRRLSDGQDIPMVDGNRDYEEYKEWLAEGNIPEPEFTEAELLSNAKEMKRQEIRNDFELASNLPVKVGTITYHGGFDSAIKLDAAKRLSEASGTTSVTFFDTDNLPHTLSLVDAQNVVTQIAGKYQIDFANKQARMVAVDNATTIQEVLAV